MPKDLSFRLTFVDLNNSNLLHSTSTGIKKNLMLFQSKSVLEFTDFFLNGFQSKSVLVITDFFLNEFLHIMSQIAI